MNDISDNLWVMGALLLTGWLLLVITVIILAANGRKLDQMEREPWEPFYNNPDQGDQ